MTTVAYRKVEISGLNVFYREAGQVQAPALLLSDAIVPSWSQYVRQKMLFRSCNQVDDDCEPSEATVGPLLELVSV